MLYKENLKNRCCQFWLFLKLKAHKCFQKRGPWSRALNNFRLLSQDEDLQEMRQSAVQIDQQYGHLVDRVLIKEDSASACAELRAILERLERESFWVPISWVRT